MRRERRGAIAFLVVLVACAAPGPAASQATMTATLTPLALSTDPPRHMKSSGQVVAVRQDAVWIRVDAVNAGAQASLDGALIGLRVDGRTTFAQVAHPAASLRDLSAGDRVTFAFDPGSLDPDGTYLATVIGR